MDIPVQIAMILMVIVLAISCSLIAKNAKHWTDWLAALCCFIGAAFIAYGISIQCDGMAVFYRCGG